MKTEELKALGLDEDQIKEVFRLHGLVVNEFKELESTNKVLEAEKSNLETQLQTANEKIEEFKTLDVEGIRKEAEEYKQKYEESTQTHLNEVENLKRDFSIESALRDAKVKNPKAAKALLNMDDLISAKDFNEALSVQINGMKESDSYLFQGNADPHSMDGTKNTEPPKKNMTYSEMVEYLEKNPGAQI